MCLEITIDGQLGTGDKETQITPKKLNIKEKFTDISAHSHYNISIAVSDKNVFYIWGKCGEKEILKPKETEFNSFEEIFANYLQITNKTIDFRQNKTNNTLNKPILQNSEFSSHSNIDSNTIVSNNSKLIKKRTFHMTVDTNMSLKRKN